MVASTDLAAEAPADRQAEAKRLAAEADEQLAMVQYVDTSRNIVNYLYWMARCQAERTDDAIQAHKALYEADRAFRDVEFERAHELYEQGFKSWRLLLDAYPPLLGDSGIGEDLVRSVKRYRRCLKELNLQLPQEFILQDVVDEYEQVEPGTKPAKTKEAK